MFILSMKVVKKQSGLFHLFNCKLKLLAFVLFWLFFVCMFKAKRNQVLSNHSIQNQNTEPECSRLKCLGPAEDKAGYLLIIYHRRLVTLPFPCGTHILLSIYHCSGGMKPHVGSRRLLEGEETLLGGAVGSTGLSSSTFTQWPQCSCRAWHLLACLGKEECAATTETPRAFQVREERMIWPLSSGVRRWAWGSSSCRWRLPTAAWLSSGSWGSSSSEMWVVPGWHAELLEMCPSVCLSFPQSTWERCTYREAKKFMVRAGFPQGCSETHASWQGPTHPWAPSSAPHVLCTTVEQSIASLRCRKFLHEGPSVTAALTAKLCGKPQVLGHEESHGIALPVGPSQTQWCLLSAPKALVLCWC